MLSPTRIISALALAGVFGLLVAGGSGEPVSGPGSAARPSQPETTANADGVRSHRSFHEVVEAQMKAIRARDEGAAWAHVSQDYQKKYDNAETFFRVLRFGYRPLYRHMSYDLLRGTAGEDVAWQRIELTGPDGMPDIAIIRLIRDPEGAWRIDGYTFLRSEREPL